MTTIESRNNLTAEIDMIERQQQATIGLRVPEDEPIEDAAIELRGAEARAGFEGTASSAAARAAFLLAALPSSPARQLASLMLIDMLLNV